MRVMDLSYMRYLPRVSNETSVKSCTSRRGLDLLRRVGSGSDDHACDRSVHNWCIYGAITM